MFSANEETLHKIFSEKRYAVPYYQRPYSWKPENCENLWDDLYQSFQEEGIGGGGYFLGSVVLVSKDENRRDDIVDGQQRLLTLQLLLSAIVERINDRDTRRRLLRYVVSEEDEFAGTKAELVVEPARRFVEAYSCVIKFENEAIGAASEKISRPFKENLNIFTDRAKQLEQRELLEFAKYIIQRAHIAVLRAETEVKALRIFSVLNDRGIDLHPVDILKARLLETTDLSTEHKQNFADRWEQYEEEFERQRFQDLIGHIRMCDVRGRTRLPLHEDILSRNNTSSSAERFFKKVLPDFSKAFSEMLSSEDVGIRDLMVIGNRAGFKDWEAPLLYAIKESSRLGDKLTPIVKRLTSLVAIMVSIKTTAGQRAGRFGRIINEIEEIAEGTLGLNHTSALGVTKAEFDEFKRALRANAYGIPRFKATLLWLESIIGDGGRSIDTGEITIEHLLPRTPGKEQSWSERFSKEEWAKCSNRVGNLVLVSGRSNRKMGRKQFVDKCKYLQSKGSSQWLWTRDAIEKLDWTKEEIQLREDRIFKSAKGVVFFVHE